jgi:phospholipase/carboxylesterase
VRAAAFKLEPAIVVRTPGMRHTSRLTSAALLASLLCAASSCAGGEDAASETAMRADDGLEARPGRGGGDCSPGEHVLRLGDGRRALMRVSAGAVQGRKTLVLVLHGAGGGSRDGLYAFRGASKLPGVVLVAPASAGSTWSVFGTTDTDLSSVERALRRAFARCPVAPGRVAIGGFSDGATYALTLGLENGDLFRHVLALSPGGVLAQRRIGKPSVFVAHGTLDRVLPIERASDAIVRDLRSRGYDVTYRRFRGGHEARPAMSRAAVRSVLGP